MISYRDLRVWQAAMDLALDAMNAAEGLPIRSCLELAKQINRSAISVPSNIAEGHARRRGNQFLYHLSVAIGSLAELETQMELAFRSKHLSSQAHDTLTPQMQSVGRQLNALYDAVSRARTPEGPTRAV